MPAFKVLTTLVYLGSSSNLMKPLKSVRRRRHRRHHQEGRKERETFNVAYKKLLHI